MFLIYPPNSPPIDIDPPNRSPEVDEALRRLGYPLPKAIQNSYQIKESIMTPQEALQILQGKIDGDIYAAANVLAAHIEVLVNDADGLTDWLAEGDYSGDETVADLVAEWNSLG